MSTPSRQNALGRAGHCSKCVNTSALRAHACVCLYRGIDSANQPARLEQHVCAARQFAPQALDEARAKALVPGYGNGRASMLAPAKAQSSLLRRAPFDIDFARFGFESAMSEGIRAKLMERHRPRGSLVGRNEHGRSFNREPVIRPHCTKRSERFADDLTQVRGLPISPGEQIVRAR